MLMATKKRKRRSSNWDRQFGRRLKVAREAAKLTQQQMADKLRLKLDTYQKYEAGARSFPKELIAELVQHTHYGPWFFLTGQPDGAAQYELPQEPSESGRFNRTIREPS